MCCDISIACFYQFVMDGVGEVKKKGKEVGGRMRKKEGEMTTECNNISKPWWWGLNLQPPIANFYFCFFSSSDDDRKGCGQVGLIQNVHIVQRSAFLKT